MLVAPRSFPAMKEVQCKPQCFCSPVGMAGPKVWLPACSQSPAEIVALSCCLLHSLRVLTEQGGQDGGSPGRDQSIPKE